MSESETKPDDEQAFSTGETPADAGDEESTPANEAQAISIETEPLPPGDELLHDWFIEQQTKSVDNLEAAARQIIALTTTLLGVLLGLLSLAKDPLPVYLGAAGVRAVAGLGVLALFAALAAALSVVFPQRTPVILNDPKSIQNVFERLLKRKHHALRAASIFFGAAMFCLVLVIGAALFRLAPVDAAACQTNAAPWWCALYDLLNGQL